MHRPVYRSRLTVEIDRDIYTRVTNQLHQGQLTQIIRLFVEGLDDILVDRQGKSDIGLWLYSGKSLYLPGRKPER